MTDSFRTATYLLACAARGIEPEIKNKIDLKSLCAVAKSQSILPTIYPVLREMEWDGEDKQIIDDIEMQSLQIYSFQYGRREFMHELYKQFNESNIRFCLLKGETLAQFYAEPLLRPASDVDIRVDDVDIDRCIELLQKNGYSVDPLKHGEHHYECHHPKYGLLELHIAFCLEKTNAIVFKNSMDFNEPYVTIDIPELGKVNMLGYTDGYIYIINHFIKHFISSGAGIRHLMDLAFYLEHYRERIDFSRAEAALRDTGYYEFYKNILYICSRYLMSEVYGEYAAADDRSDAAADKILTDMEGGGVFGHADGLRIDFYDIYLKKRAEKQGDSLANYDRSLFRKLFPAMEEMRFRYPYLEKQPYLYIIAYIDRALAHIKFSRRKAAEATDERDEFYKQRLSMLSEVGLM